MEFEAQIDTVFQRLRASQGNAFATAALREQLYQTLYFAKDNNPAEPAEVIDIIAQHNPVYSVNAQTNGLVTKSFVDVLLLMQNDVAGLLGTPISSTPEVLDANKRASAL